MTIDVKQRIANNLSGISDRLARELESIKNIEQDVAYVNEKLAVLAVLAKDMHYIDISTYYYDSLISERNTFFSKSRSYAAILYNPHKEELRLGIVIVGKDFLGSERAEYALNSWFLKYHRQLYLKAYDKIHVLISNFTEFMLNRIKQKELYE